MGPIRTLVAAVVLTGSLGGCAAGLHDETSKEGSTPYVGGAGAGGLKVRDVAVILPFGVGSTPGVYVGGPAPGPSPSPGDNGQTQGSLTLVVVNDGSAPDNITGIQVGNDGAVTPTDPNASGTVDPGHSLIFGTHTSSVPNEPANDLSISGLSSPLAPGTTVKVTVTFQNAGQIVVQAPVLDWPGA